MKLFDFIKKIFRKQEEIMLQTVDRKVETELALEAAKQRAEKAHRALREFRAEHMAVINDQLVYLDSKIAVRADLDRQLHALEIEIDAAMRHLQKSLADWRELQPPRSCISAGKVAQS